MERNDLKDLKPGGNESENCGTDESRDQLFKMTMKDGNFCQR